LRRRVGGEPAGVELLDYSDQGLGLKRLDEIIQGAELAGFQLVLEVRGGGEDHRWEVMEAGLAAPPIEETKAVAIGHLEVHEDQSGERMLSTIGEKVLAGQVTNGLAAVGGHDEGMGDRRLTQGAAEKHHVGLFVFGYQDRRQVGPTH